MSIDQTLEGEALIQSVANLAALYSSIPVIAAYDEKDTPAWLKTMRRPWISFDVGAYKSNPTRVTYVGHVEGQGTAEKFGFEHMLDRVWRSSYTNSILMVLSNQVSMGNTRDFRYMIPDYASTLTLCHFSMRRADYLLSAAILAQTNETDIRLNGDLEFIDQHFDLYSFSNASYAGYHDSRDIILSGQKIAIWYRGMDGRSNERRKLSAELGAEETILSSIGEAKSPRTQAAPRKSTTSASPQIEIKRADFG